MSDSIKTIDLGPNASVPVRRYQLDWFDYWLKTSEKERALKPFPYPPVRIFVMGANVWRDEQEWPLARAIPTPFYLASARGANSLDGDGTLARKPKRRDGEDKYVYDPHRPVATAGGPVCCNPKIFPWGPMDQRPVEKRRDVLVYTTPPLKEDMEVTGPIRVVLHVATSARDTDFTAKLVDVYPDGRAINLTDGILRLRYRESLEKPSLVQPNSVCAITIDAGVTSVVFKKKHAVRLEISSSNFPRFDRNLNTGRSQADETTMLSANQTIYHGRGHPSHLLLPVVPSSGSLLRTSVDAELMRR
jgi:hypothetical protein